MEGLCPCGHEPTGSIVPVSWLVIYIYIFNRPMAVYDGCGSVAFVYWLRLKQYL